MACAQRNTKTKAKAKKKDSANINQRAAHIASGDLDEKEWDNVCPRCDRALYVFQTTTGQTIRCRGWDLTGMPCTLIKACQDEAVNFKVKNINRTKDGNLATGSGGPYPGPHTSSETSMLPGQEGGSKKSNSQQRLDSSDASPDVKPRVGARTVRSVAVIHQQFQHLQHQQQLAASSNLESWQMFHQPGENDKSTGGQSSMDTRMDYTNMKSLHLTITS